MGPECGAALPAPLTAGVVVHASLGQHGVVLDLRLADRGAVVGDQHQLGCMGTAAPRMHRLVPVPPYASLTGRRSGAHADALRSMTTRLTLAGAQGLQAGLVAQGVLAGLHHQRQPAVDVLLALLLLVLNACTATAAVEVSGRRGSSEDAQAAPTHSRALTTFLDSALDDMVTDTSFSAYAQTAWRGAPVSTYPARAICLLLSPAAMHGMSGVPKGSRGRVVRSGRDGQCGRRRYDCAMKVWEITFFKRVAATI